MTRRAGLLAAAPAAALALALLTGCGGQQHAAAPGPAAPAPGSTSPAPSASQLAHMQKLVDDADSAAAVADSDAANDK
ncbi:hypothetical protein GA0115240_11145 [Streptomyces sp. DvalAA-14]|uniref:hypothetical protein n=1 Tax=unclassified Streptomyces TaxID=2593676 RepID=UPI00081B1E7C|nr:MULTISPECIES: hypothetical protein [unclassified Streptomyces]MYS19649.1 hypothetical protein [Streptomyces sp. SID4948]SCD49764.1 hypothetical protein GA0115240_11145 [Streptomyces sp. DvalAA-14]